MCAGVPILADNEKAVYGKGTNSHSTTEKQLHIDGDKFRKFEWLWWEKKLQQVHYDRVAEDILADIDEKKATKHARNLVKTHFNTQYKLAQWLKDVPGEWDKLLDPQFRTLAKKVNPLLITYQEKIEAFKKQPIEQYNPYQATKLPKLEELKKYLWDQVWAQVWDQVGAQVWDQVRAQVRATSYWGIKIILNLPIHHWFFDFLKLGVMVVSVQGKIKVFGKQGKYLGEYDEKDWKA